MTKFGMIGLLMILLSASVYSLSISTIFNPFTGTSDYVRNEDILNTSVGSLNTTCGDGNLTCSYGGDGTTITISSSFLSWLTAICPVITGSSDLCDGGDATGAGGSAAYVNVVGPYLYNVTNATIGFNRTAGNLMNESEVEDKDRSQNTTLKNWAQGGNILLNDIGNPDGAVTFTLTTYPVVFTGNTFNNTNTTYLYELCDYQGNCYTDLTSIDTDTNTFNSTSDMQAAITLAFLYNRGVIGLGNLSCADGNCTYSTTTGVITIPQLDISEHDTSSILITESQISDLAHVTNATITITESQISDIGDYVTSSQINITFQVNITGQECDTGDFVNAYADGTFTCGTPSGGSGASKWVDSNGFLHPNSTYSQSINVSDLLSLGDVNASAFYDDGVQVFVNSCSDGNCSFSSGVLSFAFLDLAEFDNSASGFITTSVSSLTNYFLGSDIVARFYNKTEVSAKFVNRSDWTTIDNYPSGCSTGQVVQTVGDALTCVTNYNTSEEFEDTAGGMVTGNTETLIAVTYQDGDGTIDFVVEDMRNHSSEMVAAVNGTEGIYFPTICYNEACTAFKNASCDKDLSGSTIGSAC